MSIPIRECTEEDLAAVLDIQNDAILNTTASWSYAPVDLASRRALLAARQASGYPFLVAGDPGRVAGFGSFGDFRPWDGYHRTVEHSVYVHKECRREGIGGLLLPALMFCAERLGKHVMIGAIGAGNAASVRLHEKFGFVETGRLREVGYKFERYLDLVFMQRILA